MPEVRRTLDATEEFLDRDKWRPDALELLHSRALRRFVSRPGLRGDSHATSYSTAVVLKEEPPAPLPSAPPATVDYRRESEPMANTESLRTKHSRLGTTSMAGPLVVRAATRWRDSSTPFR